MVGRIQRQRPKVKLSMEVRLNVKVKSSVVEVEAGVEGLGDEVREVREAGEVSIITMMSKRVVTASRRIAWAALC